MRQPAFAVLGVLWLAGCAAGTAPQVGSTDPAPARVARGGANLITSAEIEAAGTDMNTAYDLVERLRPSMLRFRHYSARESSSAAVLGPVVYVDDVRLGAPDLLRTVMRASVREIRFLNASDATTRFGTGHMSGAIQVLTKR